MKRLNWRLAVAEIPRQPAAILLIFLITPITTWSDDSAKYLSKTEPERATLLRSRPWIQTIEREVPTLTHHRKVKMPMIMWHGVGYDPLDPGEIKILRERGLCQHFPLHEAIIPAAKALSDAGMPVVIMEGRSDSWPYTLADEIEGQTPGSWAHQFDPTYVPPWFGKEDSFQWHGACPNHTEGWKILETRTRDTLQKFKNAGVSINLVATDFEGDPYPWPHLFEQLRHCRRCRNELPADVVQDKSAWRDYAWQQYVKLYDQHFAKPIREIFPDALVTNWHVVYSSADMPIRDFVGNHFLPELRPQFFNATNPIAYASDSAWQKHWDPETELTQTNIDNFYAGEMTHQVKSDLRNREMAGSTRVRSIPWIARVCRIESDLSPSIPVMSRERYLQTLAELWALDVYAMQVFNPMHKGYEELALTELQDAVAAFDKMLSQAR